MTLLSRFCMSSRRLYQLSDREVTSPAEQREASCRACAGRGHPPRAPPEPPGARTDHAVDRAEEHRALRGRGRLAQVLHDQGAVAEDVDELAQVEEPDLLQVLPLLVGGGSAERQSHQLSTAAPALPGAHSRGRGLGLRGCLWPCPLRKSLDSGGARA